MSYVSSSPGRQISKKSGAEDTGARMKKKLGLARRLRFP
jgi:hypothetical protein